MLEKTQHQFHNQAVSRAKFVGVILALTFCVIIGRLFWIQCIHEARYQKKAFQQHWKKKTTFGTRGNICDRNGKLLAISTLGYSCYADPKMIKAPEAVAKTLAPMLEMDESKLLARLTRKKTRFVWLKRQLDKEQHEKIIQHKFSGIAFQREPKRVYPNQTTASHILGFVGLDNKGLEGMEASFEPELQGQDGYSWQLVDGRMARSGIYMSEAPAKESTRGADLYLTIDLSIQEVVEQQLDEIMENHKPISASCVVLSVQTGEILAMAARPNFNPNNYRQYPQENWKNPIISNVYELGSVMKPFIYAGCLSEGLVAPETEIFCHNGSYRNPEARRTLHDHHSYGKLTASEIIVNSSNIGTALLAEKLGKEKLAAYLSALGFGSETGIYLPGESRGLTKPFQKWTPSTMMSIPMGHEIGCTVLQMGSAFNTLVGDGQHKSPHIVSKLVYPGGQILDRHAPKDQQLVFSPKAIASVRQTLRRVVVEGTAKRANIKGVSVAGKTGTAQKLKQGKYSHSHHVSSFVGCAPAENPVYSCIISVDEPKGSQYGGTVAAPYAAKILRRSLFSVNN